MSLYQLLLYGEGPNVFDRDVVVEMTSDDAVAANRAACRMRLHLRWWPVKERPSEPAKLDTCPSCGRSV